MKFEIFAQVILILLANIIFTSCPSSTGPEGNILLKGTVTIECTRTAVNGQPLGTFYILEELNNCNASLVNTNGDSIAIYLDSNKFIFRDLKAGDYRFNLEIGHGTGLRFQSEVFNLLVSDTNRAFNFLGSKIIYPVIDTLEKPFPNPNNSVTEPFSINCILNKEQSFTVDLINLNGQSIITPDSIRKYAPGTYQFTLDPGNKTGVMFIVFKNDSLLAYSAVLKK